MSTHCNFRILICLALFFTACGGFEQSEKEKIRRRNCKGEVIHRKHTDFYATIQTPTHTPRSLYPWESEVNLPRITKDFFRCRGNPLNPALYDPQDPQLSYADCEGSRHGLPIIQGKEGVYPILLDLLNYLQKKTGKRVIITCGHRCPVHNLYADFSKENRTSKHQIGAEVDFYLQGMEDRPHEILGLLMQYYQEHPAYQNEKEYLTFQRLSDSKLTEAPWMNKEVVIKLYQRDEGRDGDNHHPHPYLSIQVRHDRAKGERVVYDWEKAAKGYPRG